MGELLIAIALLFGPMLVAAILHEWREAREIDSQQKAREESPSYRSALACVKILDMTVTNNDSPAFGSTFFEDLEAGLRRLNASTEEREVL